MNKRELELQLDSLRQWILAADQKISIALVLVAATVSLMATPTYDLLKANKTHISTVIILFLYVALILMVWSLIKLLVAIRPRVKPIVKGSLIYFGSISGLKLPDFKSKIGKVTPAQYKDDLINQIYINSIICTKKHSHYKDGLLIFVSGLVFWIVFVALVLKVRYG